MAHAGDAVARGLYERAAVELGGQVTAVIEQTGLAGDFPVGLIGSAFKAGPLFVEPLAAAVRRVAPVARVAVVEMAPVGGCLLLAARACGREQSVDPVALKSMLDSVLAPGGRLSRVDRARPRRPSASRRRPSSGRSPSERT